MQPGGALGFGARLQGGQVGGAVQPRQFGLPGGQGGGQLFRRAAPAAGQREPLAQALIDFAQGFGVGFGAGQPAAERVGHVARLGDGRFQQLGQGGEVRLDVALRLQGRLRLLQRGQGVAAAAVAVALQGFAGGLRGVDEGLGVGQAFVALVEFGPFAFAGGEFFEFADLPLQALALLRQGFLRGAGFVQLAGGGAPGVPGGSQRRGVQPRVGVQQGAGGGGPGEALPGVLAVNVYQPRGGFAQLGGGGGRAVDPRAAFAACVHGAAQQQRGFWLKARFLQPGGQGRGGVEFGSHFAAAGAFAHGQGVGARAQGQLHRIEQDGFARAGFAGERRKAR